MIQSFLKQPQVLPTSATPFSEDSKNSTTLPLSKDGVLTMVGSDFVQAMVKLQQTWVIIIGNKDH